MGTSAMKAVCGGFCWIRWDSQGHVMRYQSWSASFLLHWLATLVATDLFAFVFFPRLLFLGGDDGARQ